MMTQFRELPKVEGYSIDIRLGELRHEDTPYHVIKIDSPRGRKMMARYDGDCDASVGDRVVLNSQGLQRLGDKWKECIFTIIDDPDSSILFDRDAVGDQTAWRNLEGPVYPNELTRA